MQYDDVGQKQFPAHVVILGKLSPVQGSSSPYEAKSISIIIIIIKKKKKNKG